MALIIKKMSKQKIIVLYKHFRYLITICFFISTLMQFSIIKSHQHGIRNLQKDRRMGNNEKL
jgi:hypothetical protein